MNELLYWLLICLPLFLSPVFGEWVLYRFRPHKYFDSKVYVILPFVLLVVNLSYFFLIYTMVIPRDDMWEIGFVTYPMFYVFGTIAFGVIRVIFLHMMFSRDRKGKLTLWEVMRAVIV